MTKSRERQHELIVEIRDAVQELDEVRKFGQRNHDRVENQLGILVFDSHSPALDASV